MRKTTPTLEVRTLNRKEITLGHKLETTLGRELRALNGKELTLGHR